MKCVLPMVRFFIVTFLFNVSFIFSFSLCEGAERGTIAKIMNQSLSRNTTSKTTKQVIKAGEPLITINADGTRTASPLITKDLFKTLVTILSKSYSQTRRVSETEYEFPSEITGEGDSFCPESGWLKDNGVSHLPPFKGIHGAGTETREDYGGFVSHKFLGNDANGMPVHALIITFRGSQGEAFEKGGGFLGPSWLTNFASEPKLYPFMSLKEPYKDGMPKITFQLTPETIRSITLNISQKTGSTDIPNKEKISLLNWIQTGVTVHSGYANRFFSFVENGVMLTQIKDTLKSIGIKPFAEFKKSLSINEVDAQNKAKVIVIVQGHSQGGGLTQIAVLFFALWFNWYIYGDGSLNTSSNMVYGLAWSPARAWVDLHTKLFTELVVGKNNIMGFGMLYDPVQVMPCGKNVQAAADFSDKVASWTIGFITKKVLSACVKPLMSYIPNDYKTAADLVVNGKFNYETISYWAYGDPIKCLEFYAKAQQQTAHSFCEKMYDMEIYTGAKSKDDFANTHNELNAKGCNGEKALLKMDEVKEMLDACTNYYNLAHRSGFFAKFSFISNVKSAINNIKNVLNIFGFTQFIAAMHFGKPIIRHRLNDNKKYIQEIKDQDIKTFVYNSKYIHYISDSFSVDAILNVSNDGDLQKCVKRAQDFDAAKRKAINGK